MKEPQHYLKCGYEDVGYKSPELSSSEIYTDYIKKEVEDSVKKIQSHQSYDTVTFAFMTDLHLALNYNHNIRMKRTINAYKEIAKRVHIDKLILGGDYTNEGCKEYKSDCFRELRALFDGVTYYPVNGNHDDGSIWDKAYIKADKSTNHLTHEEMYNLFYNHLPSCGAEFDENNHSLYYMYNDNVKKTRYIFIDACDIPYTFNEDGKLVYYAQWLFAMSQKQIDWLTNAALKFDEDGWQVMFCMHSVKLPYKKEIEEIDKNMAVLNDIISYYKNGKNCVIEANEGDFKVKVNSDFSKYKRAEVVGFFVGDYHRDEIQKTQDDIPYVLTGNAVMYCVDNTKYTMRYDGDKSELLFDIVTVDKKSRTIHIVRVGAGEDREVKY